MSPRPTRLLRISHRSNFRHELHAAQAEDHAGVALVALLPERMETSEQFVHR